MGFEVGGGEVRPSGARDRSLNFRWFLVRAAGGGPPHQFSTPRVFLGPSAERSNPLSTCGCVPRREPLKGKELKLATQHGTLEAQKYKYFVQGLREDSVRLQDHIRKGPVSLAKSRGLNAAGRCRVHGPYALHEDPPEYHSGARSRSPISSRICKARGRRKRSRRLKRAVTRSRYAKRCVTRAAG
jgi:hypothetical protein